MIHVTSLLGHALRKGDITLQHIKILTLSKLKAIKCN